MSNSNDLSREQMALGVSEKILAELKAGDVDHGLSIAEMLLSEGPDFSPEILVVLVESIVELSVHAGSQDARNYLNDKWPTLRRAHLRRLLGNQKK